SAYGIPGEGVKVAELFLKGGVVTRLSGQRVTEQVLNADPSRNAWDQPMALLVDSGTAGPAEIVAAALHHAGRSPLGGERTFGRAPSQRAIPLAEGGLLLTVAKYVSPKGTAIHGHGVEPTVAVESASLQSADEAKGSSDPILEKALEVLKTEAKKAA